MDSIGLEEVLGMYLVEWFVVVLWWFFFWEDVDRLLDFVNRVYLGLEE